MSVSLRFAVRLSLNIPPDAEERNAIRLLSAEFNNITNFIQKQLEFSQDVHATSDGDVNMDNPEGMQDGYL